MILKSFIQAQREGQVIPLWEGDLGVRKNIMLQQKSTKQSYLVLKKKMQKPLFAISIANETQYWIL